jgi:hypothetical protein
MQPCMVIFLFLFYSINLICVSISIIVYLNDKIILINKFSKYNQINIMSFEIKCLDLHISFEIFKFYF